MISFRSPRLVIVVATLVALSGCAAPGAAPAPSSASPTGESPTAAPAVAATIEISATGIAVLDESGDVLAENAYGAEADVLVGMLTDAVGSQPVTRVAEPEDCASGTSYTWGTGDAILTLRDLPDAPAYPRTIGTRAAELGGLAIVTSNGMTVGDDVSDLLATLSAEEFIRDMDSSEAGYFVWETISTVEASGRTYAYGGQGMTDADGVLVALRAPGTPTSGFFC